MSDNITVVIPAVSEDRISNSLRDLTEELEEYTGGDNVQGILGGRHGYGVEFKNDTFEMHPYYWGDCACDYEDKMNAFYDNLKHEAHCYQTELANRLRGEGFKVTDSGWLDDDGKYDFDSENNFHERKSTLARELSIELGLHPEIGIYVHCTCSYDGIAKQWHETHGHSDECPMDKPNFHHYESGVKIEWYKYIGRGMEINRDVPKKEWTAIMKSCLDSLT